MWRVLAVTAVCLAGAAGHDHGKPGNITQVRACCGSALGGTCADGTLGTPCCGYGSCNVFCCGCDGGCRVKPPAPIVPPAAPSASMTPLNQWPMIITHDAATSYFSGRTCEGLATPESNWMMTQLPGTWTHQLDCGARAFDLRLLSKDGHLVAHHGGIDINVKVSDLLMELKTWQAKNPNELVIVYGNHCSGDNCLQMFHDALHAAGVPLIECSQIGELSLGSALKIGSLLAVDDECVVTNWDSSIMCYNEGGKEAKARLEADLGRNLSQAEARALFDSCYGSNSQQFLDALWNHVASISDGRGKSQSNLWMVQAHWQYDPSSVARGVAMGSCILRDESESRVNFKLAEKIAAGQFPHINFLEVDDVCDGDGSGLKILAALRSRFTMDLDVSGVGSVVV